MQRLKYLTTAGLLMITLIGCADHAKVAPASAIGPEDTFTGTDSTEPVQVAHWWETFDDEKTNQLVNLALAHNADLDAAGARVLEARALLGVAQGQRLPQVSVGSGFTRDSSNFPLPGGRVSTQSNTVNFTGSVSWQVDLFGRLRQQQEGAAFDLRSAEFNRLAIQHTVIAETVRARVQIAILHRQLDLTRANTASFERTQEITERRYERGVANAVEIRLARENVLASRAAEPEIEYQLTAAHNALAVLTGRVPGHIDDPGDTLTELPPNPTPGVGMPLELLDRRPDLKASEFAFYAGKAAVGVAIADLYPDITLSASGGWRGDRADQLFEGDSLVWTLAADAVWRVWAGGTLRAQVDASEARVRSAAANYRQAVLRAMAEVENALARDRTARESHQHRDNQTHEAQEAERLARQRYERGVGQLLTVLETERRRQNAEVALLQDQLNTWNARIDLYLALGGSWTEPTSTPVAAATEES